MKTFSKIVRLTFISTILFSFDTFATDTVKQLTINDCIKLSLEQNTDIIIAHEDQKIAKAQTTSAWSTVCPKLTIETDYAKIHSKQLHDTIDSFAVKLSAQQLVWGGQVMPVLEAANYALNLADDSFLVKKNTVILIAKETYINVLKTEELVKSARENKKLIEQIITQTESLISAGLATRADLLKLQLQLKNIEQMVINTDNGAKVAKQSLNLLLGFPIDQSIELKPYKTTDYNELLNLNTKELVTKALTQRKELSQLDYQLKLLNTQAAVINSATQPVVLFSGNYGLINDKLSFDVGRDKDWLLALVAKWTFFDANDTQSKVDVNRSSIKKLQELRKQLVNGIELEVNIIVNGITSSIAKIDASQKELELAKENVSIAEEKYINGLGTNLDIIDSQTSLLAAQTNLINANYDLEIAKARLYKAIGEMDKI